MNTAQSRLGAGEKISDDGGQKLGKQGGAQYLKSDRTEKAFLPALYREKGNVSYEKTHFYVVCVTEEPHIVELWDCRFA